MKINLKFSQDLDDDPATAEEKNNELILTVHREFPEAVWEKSNEGYQIYL